MPNTIAFRSNPIQLNVENANIDRKNGVIKNIVLAQVGEASGHGVHLDQNFINALAAQGNERGQIDARFGHPNACNSAMGKQIGYFENFRVEGEKAFADLKVLNAAKNAPNGGNLYEWVFDMAEERPEAIMNSIVFQNDGFFQVDDEGNEVVLENFSTAKDDREIFIKLGNFMKSDLVEDGAATDNLFSNEVNNHLFAATADQFLNDNPKLLAFLQQHPEKVFEYAKKKGIALESKGLLMQIKELFSNENDTTELDRLTIDNQQLSEKITAATTAFDELTTANETLQTEFDLQKTELEAAKAKVLELQELIDSVDLASFKKNPQNPNPKKKSYHKDNF